MKRLIKRITWIIIAFLLLFLFDSLINSRSFQLLGNLYSQIETNEKIIALTFDDGPTEKAYEIMSALDKYNIKATFYLEGSQIRDNPEGAEALVEAGHEIGNHSFSHSRLVFKSANFIDSEISRTNELIRNAGFTGNINFRPPYGKKFLMLPYVLKKYDMDTIMWSIEPETYPEIAKDSNLIAKHVIENAAPGSIILLHGMYDANIEAIKSLDIFIPVLLEEGYEFVTVNELLNK
jgi:chitin deacetylase